LLESELFGHEKGAFTGAAERRPGRFEAADGGTLFLDEIGEIDASTQVKLLRFLESRTFERLGSVKPITVDVRLVAATNRDLAAMVRAGTFREDLYYRLNVVHIALPPLRARQEDIPVLLQHFIVKAAEDNGLSPVKLDPATVTLLQHYRWPGNIRELRNFAENAVVMHRGRALSPYDLDAKFRAGDGVGEAQPPMAAGPAGAAPEGTPPLSVEEHEKGLLRQALLRAGGNRTEAARLLGISRRTLHRKLARWPELDR
jgi:two-component system, NtrC family, response regulator AtoC